MIQSRKLEITALFKQRSLLVYTKEAWKIPHIVKGMATYLPLVDLWRRHRAATGGSDSARYCYSVWLRHLSILGSFGFDVKSTRVGELGPGDSIGTGLAALLSGAQAYVGLDIVPFSAKANLKKAFDELVAMYLRREPIPNNEEFPRVRPRLESYNFPHDLVDCTKLAEHAAKIRRDLEDHFRSSETVTYCAPWSSADVIARDSLDLIFSQAVLEHVDDLETTYGSMAAWLKPGGYASHVIDFGAHHLSPFWNGHWAYGDFEWRLVRGQREYLLNRQPLSRHLKYAQNAGLILLRVFTDYGDNGLPQDDLAPRYRELSAEDRRTRGTILILKKQS